MNIKNLFVKYIKLRNKLSKAKIYKITDNTNDNKYIGSTCQSLKTRLSKHKCDYKKFLKGIFPIVTSFDIIKNNDYKIELLENCDIKTKQELLTRERYYIENNECLNHNIPGRTGKEYYNDNKDKIKDKIKDYYITNKDKKKDYYITNKDKIKEYIKNYRVNNKDKNNEKFECECGGKYTRCHKSHHFKSTKHQEFIKVNN